MGRTTDHESRRTAVIIATVAALAVLLAGTAVARLFGSSAQGPDVAALVDRGIRRTADRDGMSYEVSLRVDGDRQLDVSGATAVTNAAAQGIVQVSRAEATSAAEVAFLVQGRRLFLQPPEPDTTWAEVDMLAAVSDTGDEESALLGLALQRPIELLAVLRGVQDGRLVGEREDVDGIRTDHYRGTVSFEAALSRPTQLADQDLVRSVTERLDGDDLLVDVWIDGNGKLRQVQLGGTLDGGRDYELSMRFTSFGDTVEIVAPDAVPVEPLDLAAVLGLAAAR